MRQIILDTETTGLSIERGDRVIEIGCVEMVNRHLTGRTFHCYLNPERQVEAEAMAVHHLTDQFLLEQPKFMEIFSEFLAFIKESELIIHNAPFDMSFLNYEMQLIAHPQPLEAYVKVFDTLPLARQKFPGQKNTLDALCRRFEINLEQRQLDGHGALLDSELLARVYLRLTGGQLAIFDADNFGLSEELGAATALKSSPKVTKIISITEQELEQHQVMLDRMAEQHEPLWLKS